MDPRFPNFMFAELQILLSELQSAQQPSNIDLYEKVMQELSRQYGEAAGLQADR